MKHKIFTLFFALMASIGMSAERQRIELDLTFEATSINDWTVLNATLNETQTDVDKEKYVYDIQANVLSETYVTAEPNIQFRLSNVNNKSRAFSVHPGKCYEYGGKNGILVIKNTNPHDIIRFEAAAKGSVEANFVDEAGIYPINATVVSSDLVLPPKGVASADEQGYTWRELEYESLGGDVEIKEFMGGYRIRRITINPTYTITFLDRYGNVLRTYYVQAGYGLDLSDLPTAPEYEGYEFVGWDNSNLIVGEITDDVILRPKYRELSAPTPISVSRALQIGASLADGETTEYTYAIYGYVSNISEDAFSTYRNMSFWITDSPNSTASSNADGAFYVFRGYPDKKIAVGDKVKVITKIVNWRGQTIEAEYYVKVETSLTPQLWPIIMDDQTFAENQQFVVRDFRPNNVDQFMYIWDETYIERQTTDLNSQGNRNGYFALTVNYGWAGGGFFLNSNSNGWQNAKSLSASIMANPDNYYLHLAIKSTDNNSHCFYIMDNESTKFVLGSKSVYDGPVYGNFVRDGEWQEFYIPMSAYASSLHPFGDGVITENNIFVFLSEATQGAQLNLDAVYFCNKAYKEAYYRTVTFVDNNGNLLDKQTVWIGDSVVAPDTPDIYGYTFTGWDKDLSVVTDDMVVTAQYTRDAIDGLYYIYDQTQGTATLDREGNSYARMTKLEVPDKVYYRGTMFTVTAVGTQALDGCDRLAEVVIPNTVEDIQTYAFNGCSDLAHLTLGAGVRNIAAYAFNGCRRLEDITVYADRVIDLTATSFNNVGDKSYIPVYVPETRLQYYQRDQYWSEFNLQVKSAEVVPDMTSTSVIVEPEETTASLTWPETADAASYDLVIRDGNGDIICSLQFDKDGRLIGIDFGGGQNNVAERVMMPQKHESENGFGTTSGFRFTVTGLSQGTDYSLRLAANNESNMPLDIYTATFKTKGVNQNIDNVQGDDLQSTKVLRGGQLFIERGGKTYTILGAEIK